MLYGCDDEIAIWLFGRTNISISVSRIEGPKHFKAISVNDFMALHDILVFLLMRGPTNVTGIERLFVPHMDSVDVHGSLSHFIHRVTSRWFYFHKLIFPQSRFSGFEKGMYWSYLIHDMGEPYVTWMEMMLLMKINGDNVSYLTMK